jgi:Pyruvate/2-oxoacid:ferredoxin oxidoreductase delta subunit
MDRPCIVCQENCPVSPKAIFTRDVFRTIRKGEFLVKGVDGLSVTLESGGLEPGSVATGDYYVSVPGQREAVRWKISENSENGLVLSSNGAPHRLPQEGDPLEVQVRLRQPYVDLKLCTGCGICEHECPVKGRRAIRVSAENETRDKGHKLLL